MEIPIDIAVEKVRQFAISIPGVKLIFSDMERVEAWVARKGKDEGFTTDLRHRLYELDANEILDLTSRVEPLLWVLFFLPSSTSFYLLSSLNEVAPNITDILLETSLSIMADEEIQDKRHAQIYIDRCTHLNAANFISNITNQTFSEALIKAIQVVKKDSGNVY
ncbi:type IVB secretion system protein IcmW [Pseudoalteromonas prydzensis]|uniref:type IVB secretion system protein IcmW n=1 Tax=Pseudoalteromonas prydzensis TaxID=182141 RepID=UPI003FCFCA4A